MGSRLNARPLMPSVRWLSRVSMKSISLFVFLFLVFCESVSSQTKVPEPYVVEGNAGACESNAASFDNLANVLQSSDERLFVVARLSALEKSRNLNRRRLYNVRTYFKEGWPKIDPKRFVFVEGDKVEGDGRVEFYVGSHLIQISLIKRGKDICVDCCDFPDPRYYGVGKRDKSKTKRQ